MSATDFGDPHQVIHIPARDLTGTREAKLAELDILLAQLQGVRLALCGHAVLVESLAGGRDESAADADAARTGPAKLVRTIFNTLTPAVRRAKGSTRDRS